MSGAAGGSGSGGAGKGTPGRGRGESAKIARMEEATECRYRGVARGPGQPPVVEVEGSSSGSGSGSGSSSPSSGEKTVRGRGGFKTVELHTIPSGVTEVRAGPSATGTSVEILGNFIQITPMSACQVYQYRVDYEPNVESVRLRRKIFYMATEGVFGKNVVFDGGSDARSGKQLPDKVSEYNIEHPIEAGVMIKLILKNTGPIAGGFEMIRLYNMHMKKFLIALGFFSVSTTGAYVHPALASPIGTGGAIVALRGFRTAANVHEDNNIFMNLESVHKLAQNKNVLQYMMENSRLSKDAIKAQVTGKLVVTKYNKTVYRIEDVNFNLNPMSTFPDRKNNRDITYLEYYTNRYNLQIRDKNQPLLLAIQNNRRRRDEAAEERADCYLVPELCNITGLTDEQRADNRLKIELVKASQISPADRVAQMETFLRKLHENTEVKEFLKNWGYSYAKEAVQITARIVPLEHIGLGKYANSVPATWPKVDNMGSFEREIMRESLAKAPACPKLKIIIGKWDIPKQGQILGGIKKGFDKIGLNIGNVEVVQIHEGDSGQHLSRNLSQLSKDATAAIVIIPNQNKERYDAVKKKASVELGLITQVVTSKLMCDERKAGGAGVKIGIQVAAKLGGEPWYINLPMNDAMVCGYDTYHDTTNRGRSFGAFVASMNGKFSRWYSKADSHDRVDELSSHMAENLNLALHSYRERNKKFPDRLFIYRDGVGDGQLEHVFKVELKEIKRAVKKCDKDIRLAIIIVNKRIGARFYMKSGNTFINCPPGTVIDSKVTRKERYDFYLISQSTRHGTVAPTYYNIIYDETGLDAARHQAMAYKMCFAYYNWTGTVRVPAPCQYAHKLALLCGEHLHNIPNANLDDRLHFL